MSIRSLACIFVLALVIISLLLPINRIAHAQHEATSLTISDTTGTTIDNFTLYENTAIGLTATLTTFDNHAIENENISWFLNGAGTIRPSVSLPTDSAGQVFVVYTAPSFEDNVIVTAYFAGDNKYTQIGATAKGTIITPIFPPEPSSHPSSISLNDIAIIAIAIICVIIVSSILSGKL